MDLKRINLLLDRYWNCVSTIEEEEELKHFFGTSEEVPEELKESAALFKYYQHQQQVTLDTKFEEEVVDKIKQQKVPVVRKLNTTFRNYLRVAAVILVVLSASLVFRMEFWGDEKPPTLMAVDTFKTPEEAYAETKKAFMLIAEKMNSGRKQAEKISLLNEAENKIKNQKR